MITKEEYRKAKAIVDQYERDEYETNMRIAEQELDDEMDYQSDPCPTCGEIDGMVNPCCADYDPLNHKVCGYG